MHLSVGSIQQLHRVSSKNLTSAMSSDMDSFGTCGTLCPVIVKCAIPPTRHPKVELPGWSSGSCSRRQYLKDLNNSDMLILEAVQTFSLASACFSNFRFSHQAFNSGQSQRPGSRWSRGELMSRGGRLPTAGETKGFDAKQMGS